MKLTKRNRQMAGYGIGFKEARFLQREREEKNGIIVSSEQSGGQDKIKTKLKKEEQEAFFSFFSSLAHCLCEQLEIESLSRSDFVFYGGVGVEQVAARCVRNSTKETGERWGRKWARKDRQTDIRKDFFFLKNL